MLESTMFSRETIDGLRNSVRKAYRKNKHIKEEFLEEKDMCALEGAIIEILNKSPGAGLRRDFIGHSVLSAFSVILSSKEREIFDKRIKNAVERLMQEEAIEQPPNSMYGHIRLTNNYRTQLERARLHNMAIGRLSDPLPDHTFNEDIPPLDDLDGESSSEDEKNYEIKKNAFEKLMKEAENFKVDQKIASRNSRASLSQKGKGWSLGYLDFNSIKILSDSFGSLSLKKDYDIYIFQWRDDIGGFGIPYAFPKSAPCLEEFGDWVKHAHKSKRFNPTKPKSALKDFMEAIDGDETLLSYISASIFSREVRELGAFWHALSWSTESILDEDPEKFKQVSRGPKISVDSDSEEREILDDLRWLRPKPKDWRPIVYKKDDKIIVKFFTFSRLGIETITVHYDIYFLDSYVFDTKESVIAKGKQGYIF